ncbi:hypothetical protein IEQ34_023125 [Dendrobium chrysotoxum]|uniref:BSD2 cysteine rich domain-containing protein n=1 Tax=Dendrobium chrysotoxum TaxID=161865 RepID=A0AAV7FKD1_DENCH|nr:hypothetical protein IEQ34_023125 [Dendrobium chrysotoxum]
MLSLIHFTSRFLQSNNPFFIGRSKRTQRGKAELPSSLPSLRRGRTSGEVDMINAGCFACANSILISHLTKSSIASPCFPISKSKISFQKHRAHKPSTACSPNSKIQSFRVNAAGFNPSTKPNSIVCSDCDGNGAILCTQCKGTGVNSVDHFNGQFKAGELCWLCRGKRDILCGNCNGAGFIGGFMSTFDD